MIVIVNSSQVLILLYKYRLSLNVVYIASIWIESQFLTTKQRNQLNKPLVKHIYTSINTPIN